MISAKEALEISMVKRQPLVDKELNTIFEDIKKSSEEGNRWCKVQVFYEENIETLKLLGYDINIYGISW